MRGIDIVIKHLYSDLDELKSIILCRPVNYRFVELLNENQRFWDRVGYPPIREKALKQHQELLRVLEENNVKIYLVDPVKNSPYQVFTRDLGFSADGETIFLANFKYEIRSRERESFIHTVDTLDKKIISLPEEAVLEGGNVMIYDEKTLFLGISERTNSTALNFLKEHIPINIIPVQLPNNIIHLDVVLNFPNRNLAVVYKNAVQKNFYKYITKELGINTIDIDFLDMFTLATNFLQIKENLIITAEENKYINKTLIKEGVDIIEIPYSEMIKAGGSVRCSTFPLERR